MMCYYLNVHFQGQRVKLSVLKCSLSNKFFHEKCVPHHHKIHIPEGEEEEDSLCLPHVYSKQTSSDIVLDTEWP